MDYINVYISTHALTEGDSTRSIKEPHVTISTHALTEGDCKVVAGTVEPDLSTDALTECGALAASMLL